MARFLLYFLLFWAGFGLMAQQSLPATISSGDKNRPPLSATWNYGPVPTQPLYSHPYSHLVSLTSYGNPPTYPAPPQLPGSAMANPQPFQQPAQVSIAGPLSDAPQNHTPAANFVQQSHASTMGYYSYWPPPYPYPYPTTHVESGQKRPHPEGTAAQPPK